MSSSRTISGTGAAAAVAAPLAVASPKLGGGSDRDAYASAIGPLVVFLVISHWAEHVVQAVQIYGLGWAKPDALGVLGLWLPSLVRSEWLHWVYNLAVLVGLVLLLPGYVGRARTWWKAALLLQTWHFGEHALLLAQVSTAKHLFGAEVPTSVVQLLIPRVELHLLYNGVVTIFLLVGAFLRMIEQRDRQSKESVFADKLALAWRRPHSG